MKLNPVLDAIVDEDGMGVDVDVDVWSIWYNVRRNVKLGFLM